MSSSPPSSCSPPWEVLVLVSQYLDPKTLAIASCVCKSWSVSMSSNQLWKPICTSRFPSLADHLPLSLSYRRLYSVFYTADIRRHQTPLKPQLSLSDLIFTLTITTSTSDAIISMVKPSVELLADPNGMFRFNIVAEECESFPSPAEGPGAVEEVKVTWNVVLKGWRGIFTMMDCVGKMNISPGAEGWFSAELPPLATCRGVAEGSGMVADLKFGFGGRRENSSGDGPVRAEKVSVGILSVVNWRYVTVEDALRYLQHFLLPII